MNIEWFEVDREAVQEWARHGKALYLEVHETYDCDCPECYQGTHSGREDALWMLVAESNHDVDYLIETLVTELHPTWDDFHYTYLWVIPDDVDAWAYRRTET